MLVMTLGLAAALLLLPEKISAQTPFGGTPAATPGTIQNENCDTGGHGVAYKGPSIFLKDLGPGQKILEGSHHVSNL